MVNRCRFVADHQRRYGVRRICRVLGIARSSFHYWLRTSPDRTARQARDAETTARMRAVHAASDGTCGVPRVTAELRESGEAVNHKKVARLMKAGRIAGLRLRRRHRTTVADQVRGQGPGPGRPGLHRGRGEHRVRR